ncbi:MAG: hypothetical protein C5B54_08885, partial [Acidobacteria bacterium]
MTILKGRTIVILFLLLPVLVLAADQDSKIPDQMHTLNLSLPKGILPSGTSQQPVSLMPPDNPLVNMSTSALRAIDVKTYGTPLALTSADMNNDGVADLIVSYGDGTKGTVVVYFTNPAAIYSHNPTAKTFSGQKAMEIFASPDRMAAGDFNADGNEDVVIAPRFGNFLYALYGDGKGGFSKIDPISVNGTITAVAVGDVNRADLLPDVLVGTRDKNGFHVLVFESPLGAFGRAPEHFDFPAQVNSIAIGHLHDGPELDFAVANGNQVSIVSGRDRKLTSTRKSQQSVKPAKLQSISFDSPIQSLSIGKFIGSGQDNIAALSINGTLRIMDRSGSAWTAHDVEGSFAGSNLFAGRLSGGPHENLMISGSSLGALSASNNKLATSSVNVSISAALPIRLNSGAQDDLVVINHDTNKLMILPSAPAVTFIVNTTADTNDAAINGTCDDGTGHCSLRAAIQEANATVALDAINFNIPGSGPFTITLGSDLPQISAPVIIDGTTEPGSSTNTWPATLMIEVNATSAVNPFWIQSGGAGTTIRGFVINHASNFGMVIVGNNNVITYNYIGTNVAGSAAAGNAQGGIDVGGSSGNRIGGTSVGERNLISGNGNVWGGVLVAFGPISGTVVEGNYIGTDATGTTALGNGGFGGVFL